MRNRYWTLANGPVPGWPQADTFLLKEGEIPRLGPGQALTRTIYVSLDPYQWGYKRRGTEPKTLAELRTFAGRTIDVPACFIAGKSDWGTYQTPGVFERMQTTDVCTQWRGAHLVDGAGHWVQQEQPDAVVTLLVQFLRS